ncbi:unnamed protein product [Phytophthora lilii]|uniref:Unnamed protein product n=1 Tax=Phytophthora lilii TaxID=2077276 RepID=A0A9W7CWC5_9STRA|nr:unnamed protein product [Phytophthora lilii]
MQMVLEERDLWEVVSGESKLENCATALDQAAFKRKSRKALIEGCRVLVLRTSNRSAQTGSIRTHADYATTDYATVDYATCGYKIVGTRWASTWRSLIG